MEVFYRLREIIDEEIANGNTKFIVFPYGKAGEIARTILCTHCNVSYILADNRKTGTGIYGLDAVTSQEYKEYRILFCCLNDEYYSKLKTQLKTQGIGEEKIVDLYERCLPDLYCKNIKGGVAAYGLTDARQGMLQRCAGEIYHRGITGNCAEAGVFRGDFAKCINFWFPDRTLYLADTFEGFPEKDVEIERLKGFSEGGQDWSDTNVKDVLSKMPFAERCVVKKGRFPDSMRDVDDKFAYVSLDMDLYQPISAGLEYFYPRLNAGGYIMVHDCCNKGYPGARAAVEEYCKRQSIGYVICTDSCGTAVITK